MDPADKLAGFERRGAVKRRGRRRLRPRLREPVLSTEEFDRFLSDEPAWPDLVALLDRLPAVQRDAVRARVIDELASSQLGNLAFAPTSFVTGPIARVVWYGAHNRIIRTITGAPTPSTLRTLCAETVDKVPRVRARRHAR
jgi:hypothetical protein